ncbi:MAG: hypothetical protein IBX71_07100 [Candidatus Desulforudis sp.]|nr:hypothetical protein [Desulforudis sp.]
MDWTLGPADVVTLGLGLVLISTGNLIMFADRIIRAAGFQIRGIADPGGLSLFLGLWVFTLGILTALYPVGVRFLGPYYGWALLALAALGVLRMSTGCRKYLNSNQANNKPNHEG